MLNKCPTVQARGKRRPQMMLFQTNNDINRFKDRWLEQQADNLLARVK